MGSWLFRDFGCGLLIAAVVFFIAVLLVLGMAMLAGIVFR